jgi:hypothetical protein
MKRLLTTFFTSLTLAASLATFSTGAIASTQSEIKNYLTTYKEMLTHIRDKQTYNNVHLLSGSYSELNTAQLTAAIEVLQLVVNGNLDTCCWTGGPNGTTSDGTANSPASYGGMPRVTGQSIIDTANIQYNYTKSNGNSSWITLGTNQKDDYRAMKDIMDVAYAIPYSSAWNVENSSGKLKYFEHKLSDRLRPLWNDLVWGFSYADSSIYSDADLKFDFRSRYAFACLVCFGAGFYDTSKLHTRTGTAPNYTYTATSAYTTIYNMLTTGTKNWMGTQHGNQYPDSNNWAGPAGQSLIDGTPLQVSTGPTWQASVGSTRGNNSHDTHVYPTHCHGSTELYKTLDPMLITQAIGTAAQNTTAESKLPYTVSGNGKYVSSYISNFGTVSFVKNMYNTWYNDTSPRTAFKWTGGTANVGAMFFNGERDYHAMHNGRWVQLTQWSRLTSPAEGTFFPKHSTNINPSSPNGDGCNGS